MGYFVKKIQKKLDFFLKICYNIHVNLILNTMYLELTCDHICNILRSDVYDNLQYDGVSALLDHYEMEESETGEKIIFDQSLFWDWHRYDDAVIAYEEKIGAWDNISANIYEEHEDDEELDDDEIQEEIATTLKDILINEYTCIELDDGSILVRSH